VDPSTRERPGDRYQPLLEELKNTSESSKVEAELGLLLVSPNLDRRTRARSLSTTIAAWRLLGYQQRSPRFSLGRKRFKLGLNRNQMRFLFGASRCEREFSLDGKDVAPP
jgi:hypothetical protein